MDRLYNWTARQVGGTITLDGTDANGVAIKITRVMQITAGRPGIFGRKPCTAHGHDGTRYLLV